MHRRVVQAYDFQAEVLPVLVVGILFNLLGRYACAHVLQPFMIWLNEIFLHSDKGIIASLGNQAFLDMGGTAYAAVMVGPWWAAVVGVTSNAINGGYYDAYFPFGVVNILGGLAWGYYATATNMRVRIAEQSASWGELAKTYVIYVLIGGVVGGLGSSITHLILYPPMNHPFTHGSAYDLIRHFSIFAGSGGETRLMFTGDLLRDLIDKALGVAGALFWILLIPVVPLGLHAPRGFEKYRSDVVSIFAFAIVYSLYLTAARFAKPVIQFLPGDHPIEWLHYPLVIAWLYVPIGLALIAYLLMSFDSADVYGRHINAQRAARQRLYRELAPPTPWIFARNELDLRFSQGRRVYGLILSIAFWPIGKEFTTLIATAVYFGVVFYALLAFSIQNRKFVDRYIDAREHIAALHRWMDVTAIKPAAEFLALLVDRIAGGLSESAGKVRILGQLVYQLVYVPRETGGRNPRTMSLAAATGGKVVLIAAVTGDKIIGESVRRDVDQLLESIKPDAVHLVSLTSGADDPALGKWLSSVRDRHIEAGLLCWYDVEDVVAAETRAEAARILVKARVRTLELTSGNNRIANPSTRLESAGDARALAARTLPSLAHVIDRLPANSTVIDLGAGRGRHTIYALFAGHDVIAVERKDEALTDLRRAITATGEPAERATIISGDYAELDPGNYDDADLVISTGALQHVESREELDQKLKLIGALANAPGAQIYIEMLFSMRFDGKQATDGRIEIGIAEFEAAMHRAFPARHWRIERASGPVSLTQDFSSGPRSFIPPAKKIELTAVEYLVARLD
jgi:hypothetical protein